MRYNHSYISLMVNGTLPTEMVQKWKETVQALSPNGVTSSTRIMVDGSPKETELYMKKNGNSSCYVIPLSRDLQEDEAGRIAIAWSRRWEERDFEICFSQPESSKRRKHEQISTLLDQLSERIAKIMHAKWMKNKSDQHWNYSPRYNAAKKQHPMLLPWEQLPDKHKKSETDRARDTLEILDSINLKIARK